MRAQAKAAAGRLPWAAELYQGLSARNRPPDNGYELDRLGAALPSWSTAVAQAVGAPGRVDSRRVLVVGYLPWWLEFSVALGLLLRAAGNEVDLGFLPYRRWTVPGTPFDTRRQTAYLRSVLARAPGLKAIDLSAACRVPIPGSLGEDLERLAMTDVEYSLQREGPDFRRDDEAAALWELRRARNRTVAANTLRRLRQSTYDAVVVPNGSILTPAVYRTARSGESHGHV
jgi:hypothetical protein